MARLAITLTVSFTPAYRALLDVVREIAERHGEEAALEWGKRVIDADTTLFCTTSMETRPDLRLIQGGLAS